MSNSIAETDAAESLSKLKAVDKYIASYPRKTLVDSKSRAGFFPATVTAALMATMKNV